MERNNIHKKTNLSYWKGETTDPLLNQTIGKLLEQSVYRNVNRTAISFYGGERLTYAEVLEKVDTLAAAYLTLGLKQGDHIAIWGFNTIQWYLSFLAAQRAGLVVVALNPLYESLEVLACLKVGDVKALIMDESLNERNFYDILKSAIPEIEQDYNSGIAFEKVPLLKTVIMFTNKPYRCIHKWNDLFAIATDNLKQQIKNSQSEISTFDICAMLFTSGTTNKPKGALLTHHSLVNNTNFVAKQMGLYEKVHKVCIQIPFFHAYGLSAGILVPLHSGATLVLPSSKFSPTKSIDCIIEEKCTVIYGTPTMYIDILTICQQRTTTIIPHPQIYDKLYCVERIITAASICLQETVTKLKKLFKNARFMSGFGMTELGCITLMSRLEDPEDVVSKTVGQVMPHTEVKVIDEDGKTVPLGTPGEMCFRGYTVMKGYYKEVQKTKEVLSQDGWFHSGDQFILMENGYAQIIGRIKDLIIRGGENIEPKEVEELLIRHPEIIDVQVYGVTDSRLGEIVAAAIVKKENSKLSEQLVKEYCQSMIAFYKIPQRVIFMDEFPKTHSGKVQKFQLRNITENLNNK